MLMQSSARGIVEVSRRARLTIDQVRRARAITMYRMKLEGSSAREIAAFFSFSRQFVNREIAAIPEWQKARIQKRLHDEVA